MSAEEFSKRTVTCKLVTVAALLELDFYAAGADDAAGTDADYFEMAQHSGPRACCQCRSTKADKWTVQNACQIHWEQTAAFKLYATTRVAPVLSKVAKRPEEQRIQIKLGRRHKAQVGSTEQVKATCNSKMQQTLIAFHSLKVSSVVYLAALRR